MRIYSLTPPADRPSSHDDTQTFIFLSHSSSLFFLLFPPFSPPPPLFFFDCDVPGLRLSVPATNEDGQCAMPRSRAVPEPDPFNRDALFINGRISPDY